MRIYLDTCSIFGPLGPDLQIITASDDLDRDLLLAGIQLQRLVALFANAKIRLPVVGLRLRDVSCFDSQENTTPLRFGRRHHRLRFSVIVS